MVLRLHVPDWIGEQTFKLRINETEIEEQYTIFKSKKFWQDVRIDLPGTSLREGNNFISLKFDKLLVAPKANLNAAAILKSIHIE